MPSFSRRDALRGLGALSIGSALPTIAHARPAPRLTSSVSAHTFALGDATVTAIRDTGFDLPLSAVSPNAPDGAVVRLLDAYGLPTESVPVDVNQFLVDSGGVRTLLDTGTGQGALVETLRAIGAASGSVDRVVVSHFHGDHLGGVSTDGSPTFPNASVHFPEPELAFLDADASGEDRISTAIASLAPVRDRLQTYADGDELAPGLSAVAAHGHTPGHMAFTLSSGDQRMLFLSDTVTHPILFFRHTNWHFGFDMDGERAVATRRMFLSRAADQKTPVVASHLPFPATGRVSREATLFRYTPVAMP